MINIQVYVLKKWSYSQVKRSNSKVYIVNIKLQTSGCSIMFSIQVECGINPVIYHQQRT